ncbi:DUF4266 domain-containing protein [Asticcacaulis sp. EMRT-3]|uniref:DUF4266 domain-containing protein n=1 Tax=Asticcacaulis sp. EMRT-3 TaxID=3040349 RepID=UPI0024AEF33D|nr:DUF4266 domain-containing protein [Asticcacaulis sp. EMRT-3]MDI7776264.1 DUF4266 domain-containing protein [Asticcacaulis sp. EMRT-3]
MKSKLMRIAAQAAGGCLLLGAFASMGGCSSLGAKAWNRDLMARRSMQPVTHPLIAAADDHIYFSKEGASGGRTFDGGGCGCN